MPRIDPLVPVAWLAEHLGDPDVAVLDATVHLDPPSAAGVPYDVRSGLAGWELAHIPGSRFADVPGELSDPDAPYPFTLPAAERFAAALERLGVGDDTFVVSYDDERGMWASRLWWMLRVFGHDRCAVLDGGLSAWSAAGQPLSAEPASPPAAASFTRDLRPGLVADRAEVLAAIDDSAVLLVNALAPDAHRGETDRYGRAGRIPGSSNVPAASLHARDGRLRPPDELRDAFEAVGALAAPRVIAYCGGGISATSDALALAVLGRDDIAIYDGSLREWAGDPGLPLERG